MNVDRAQRLALKTDQYIGVQFFSICCLRWHDICGVNHELIILQIIVKWNCIAFIKLVPCMGRTHEAANTAVMVMISACFSCFHALLADWRCLRQFEMKGQGVRRTWVIIVWVTIGWLNTKIRTWGWFVLLWTRTRSSAYGNQGNQRRNNGGKTAIAAFSNANIDFNEER